MVLGLCGSEESSPPRPNPAAACSLLLDFCSPLVSSPPSEGVGKEKDNRVALPRTLLAFSIRSHLAQGIREATKISDNDSVFHVPRSLLGCFFNQTFFLRL